MSSITKYIIYQIITFMQGYIWTWLCNRITSLEDLGRHTAWLTYHSKTNYAYKCSTFFVNVGAFILEIDSIYLFVCLFNAFTVTYKHIYYILLLGKRFFDISLYNSRNQWEYTCFSRLRVSTPKLIFALYVELGITLLIDQ